MSRIINKTPHKVNIVDKNGNVYRTFPKCDSLIRLEMHTNNIGEVNQVPLSRTVFGKPVDLPKFEQGTYYIVSQLVKNALPNRIDLLVPAELFRDSKGNIVGCKSLGM